MPKKTEKVLSGILCYARKFLVLFPGPTGEIWNFVELLVELFWSVQVVKKTPTKSHDYSRLFSLEKRRLKIEISIEITLENNM